MIKIGYIKFTSNNILLKIRDYVNMIVIILTLNSKYVIVYDVERGEFHEF